MYNHMAFKVSKEMDKEFSDKSHSSAVYTAFKDAGSETSTDEAELLSQINCFPGNVQYFLHVQNIHDIAIIVYYLSIISIFSFRLVCSPDLNQYISYFGFLPKPKEMQIKLICIP